MISAVSSQRAYGETVALDATGTVAVGLAVLATLVGLALIAYAVAPRRERTTVRSLPVAPLDRGAGVHHHRHP